jgi:hypothetical protein
MKLPTLLTTSLAIALASLTTATLTAGTTSVAPHPSTGDTTTAAGLSLAAADCKPCNDQYKKCIGVSSLPFFPFVYIH